MKSKIIVHTLLYGLFTATSVTAAEVNLAILAALHKANISKSSDSQTTCHTQTYDSHSPSRSLSSSSSPSHEHLSQKNNSSIFRQERKEEQQPIRFPTTTRRLPTTTRIPIDAFFKGAPNLTYGLTNKNKELNVMGIILADDNILHNDRYKATLIIKDNQAYIHATDLIRVVPLKEEYQFYMQATVTSEETREIIDNFLFKNSLFTINDFNDPHCISYENTFIPEENDSEESSNSEAYSDSEDSSSYEAPFITIRDKNNDLYQCIITYSCPINEQGISSKQWVVEVDKDIGTNQENFDTLYSVPIPTTKETYQEVLLIKHNTSIVIDTNHQFFTWDGTVLNFLPSHYSGVDIFSLYPEKETTTFIPLTPEKIGLLYEK